MASTRSVSAHLGARFARLSTTNTVSALDTHVVRPSRVVDALTRQARVLDRFVADALRPLALPALRVLLGVLFIWFGGLKVAGVSPVKAMVASTLPWFDPNVIVPVLGGAEVLLGLGLLSGIALRFVLPALALHLTGTFLTFVMLPGQMFHASDPLLLTENGEFVTKNLVLICAALVLFAHTSRPAPVAIPGPANQLTLSA
jgi:putative oxidoreductase